MDAILVGRERAYNRHFQQMCGHYLVEPVACTPAAGWEKGQVENQVGVIRQRFFAPRLRVRSYEELNAWLLDRCIAYAKAHPHPELRDRTVWEMFEVEPSSATGSRTMAKAAEPGAPCRALRRLPCGAGVALKDLPRALRQ